PVHRRLFSAGRQPAVLDIINADTGKLIQSFPITDGVDAARYDPGTGDIFVSTLAGRLHVFHEDSPDSFSERHTVTTEMGAKTMGLDLKTHDVFVDTADFAPPPAGATGRARRPVAILGTFRVLVYARGAPAEGVTRSPRSRCAPVRTSNLGNSTCALHPKCEPAHCRFLSNFLLCRLHGRTER